VEALPHAGAEGAEVGDGGAGVVELVGGGDQAHRSWGRAQVLEVRLLARAPGGLRRDVGVRARCHDVGDDGAEAAADGSEGLRAALVLDRVVEEGGDGLVFVAAVLEDEGGDGQEVGDVRGGGALAQLPGVQLGGVDEGVFEAGGEHDRAIVPRRVRLRSADSRERQDCPRDRHGRPRV
jgi:hypothetical protein